MPTFEHLPCPHCYTQTSDRLRYIYIEKEIFIMIINKEKFSHVKYLGNKDILMFDESIKVSLGCLHLGSISGQLCSSTVYSKPVFYIIFNFSLFFVVKINRSISFKIRSFSEIFIFLITTNDQWYQPSVSKETPLSWNCHNIDRFPPII